MRTRSLRLALVAFVALFALLVTACDNSDSSTDNPDQSDATTQPDDSNTDDKAAATKSKVADDPAAALQAAVAEFASADVYEVSLSADISDAARDAIFAASDLEAGDQAMQEAFLAGALDATLKVAVDTSKNDDTIFGGNLGLELADDTGSYLGVRLIDENLYLQTDVDRLAGMFVPDDERAGFDEGLVTFADAAPFVTDLVAGDWLSLNIVEMATAFGINPDAFLEDLAGQSAGTNPVTAATDAGPALVNDLVADATISYAGTAGDAELVDVTVASDDVVNAFGSFAAVTGLDFDESDLPEENIDISFTVELVDGTLSAITIDLADYADYVDAIFAAEGSVIVRLGFATSSDLVTAPANATKVNPEEIFGLLLGAG